jgi:uncharacterized protein YutE (UPF0331/DUF86 family)
LVDRAVREQRFARLDEELEVFARAREAGRDRFLTERSLQREVERALEVSIQACIDVAVHLVAALGLGPPEDYADAFERLARGAALDRRLADRMRAAVAQRSLLVHVYLSIDHERIWEKLDEASDLSEFARWAFERVTR